jgi:hypothetical protein
VVDRVGGHFSSGEETRALLRAVLVQRSEAEHISRPRNSW